MKMQNLAHILLASAALLTALVTLVHSFRDIIGERALSNDRLDKVESDLTKMSDTLKKIGGGPLIILLALALAGCSSLPAGTYKLEAGYLGATVSATYVRNDAVSKAVGHEVLMNTGPVTSEAPALLHVFGQ